MAGEQAIGVLPQEAILFDEVECAPGYGVTASNSKAESS